MASGFKLQINDARFQRMLNKYKQTVDEVSATMDRELAATGEDMVRSAKNLLSSQDAVDTGRLLNSISFNKEQFLSYQFVAQTDYAAYIEFGTGDDFVPPETNAWKQLAALYKGKNIKRINLKPRPYMRPSILAYWPEYQKRIRAYLKKVKKV
jgi:hypothetical protein